MLWYPPTYLEPETYLHILCIADDIEPIGSAHSFIGYCFLHPILCHLWLSPTFLLSNISTINSKWIVSNHEAPSQLHHHSPPYDAPASQLARAGDHHFPLFLNSHLTSSMWVSHGRSWWLLNLGMSGCADIPVSLQLGTQLAYDASGWQFWMAILVGVLVSRVNCSLWVLSQFRWCLASFIVLVFLVYAAEDPVHLVPIDFDWWPILL